MFQYCFLLVSSHLSDRHSDGSSKAIDGYDTSDPNIPRHASTRSLLTSIEYRHYPGTDGVNGDDDKNNHYLLIPWNQVLSSVVITSSMLMVTVEVHVSKPSQLTTSAREIEMVEMTIGPCPAHR